MSHIVSKIAMPEVHFEIIRLEDIGKDITLSSSLKKSDNSSNLKLSNDDVENLKHYLNKYNQESSHKKKTHEVLSSEISQLFFSQSSPFYSYGHQQQQEEDYVDITDELYSNKLYTELIEPSKYAQLLTDVNRYVPHQHTKHAHEQPTLSIQPNNYHRLCLEFATCGMKKNTQLPVPHENFSLENGCFGDDVGFMMQCNRQNFLGIALLFFFR